MKFKIEVDTEAKKITAEGFTVEDKPKWFQTLKFFGGIGDILLKHPQLQPKQPKPERPRSRQVFVSGEIVIKGNALGFVTQSFENNLEIREIVAKALDIGYRAGRGHREPIARIVSEDNQLWGDRPISRIKL